MVAKIFAQTPENYYSSADGLCGEALRSELFSIIKNHTTVSYDDLWEAFETTDRTANGKVWDMYSDCNFSFDGDKCGNYSNECDCYNREHSLPKSWFNDARPMYSDLFHLYPTDGKVNGMRSNYPFGEVSNASYTSGNGSKVGNCSYPGYTGKVFEPIDEYKGDFARTYFYMSTCYKDKNLDNENGSAMFSGSALKTWSANMLLEWHRSDPVSEKEIARNNAVYEIQGNRNPFIDCPEFAEAIWSSSCDYESCFSNDITYSEISTIELAISPNPANDFVQITANRQIVVLSIYNILGEQMLAQQINADNAEISLQKLQASTYFIRLVFADGSMKVEKIVKY